MQRLRALEALARLAVTDGTDAAGALSEATRIVGAAVESCDVRVFTGDGINYEAFPQREAEDFFRLSPAGLISLSQALRSLHCSAVHSVSRDGLPEGVAPADAEDAADYVAVALWIGSSYSGTLVARGPWEARAAADAGRFLEVARPALSAVLEHVVDADRVARMQRQMDALANVARVFNQTSSLRQGLTDLVSAVNSATGLLSSIDVLDARGRIAVRSTAASRFTGTPLHQAWLDMIRAPDPIRKMILKDRQPVLLPDLQGDPRIAEEAREFYRRASLVSAATFPLLFQDEVVGLLRVASLKPTAFAPPLTDLLQNLALQSAVVIKGIRLWEQLQRSQKQAERYAAKLGTRNEELLAEIAERERAEEALRQSEEVLSYLANHDALTGLPNRTLLRDRIATALAQRRRDKGHLAVLLLDLDEFKVINDMMGHAEGDRVLIGVAERMSGALREGDTVARLGGDEFTLLLPTVGGAEEACQIAQRVLERLRPPWRLAGQEFRTTASIGIAMYPEHGKDAETLLGNADTAMYRAKGTRHDSFLLFTPDMDAHLRARVAWEADLRRALTRNELVVYYQPQIDVETDRIIGMEALVRWQHPERGVVYPDDFIPLAEETGLILPLGEWVLRTACRQNKLYQEAGLPAVRVAVNLSCRQFEDDGLVAMVETTLRETGLDPQYLDLEITESTAMRDVEFSVKTLDQLRRMGVRVSIDDFGTGYSSLAYLKRLPVDAVKIDRSFVMDSNGDPEDAAIVTAIIALARTLNLRTVAEGVESAQQLSDLRAQSCDEVQGFLFGEAISGAEMAIKLGEHRPHGVKHRRRAA